MKFIVRRASQWGDAKPCDEVCHEIITRVDTRYCFSPEEYDAGHVGERKWLEAGSNHRYNSEGHIQRDYGTVDVWTIEINTLEELMKFINKYGSVVIGDNYQNENYKEILIYDDYIE